MVGATGAEGDVGVGNACDSGAGEEEADGVAFVW